MRIRSSPRFQVTKREIEEEWSLLDVQEAHETLDLLEELEWKSAEAANQK